MILKTDKVIALFLFIAGVFSLNDFDEWQDSLKQQQFSLLTEYHHGVQELSNFQWKKEAAAERISFFEEYPNVIEAIQYAKELVAAGNDTAGGWTVDGVSDSCLKSYQALLLGLLNKQPWAIKVIDSFGKLPSSLLRDGRTLSLGSYRECVEANSNDGSLPFEGQYCFTHVPSPISLSKYYRPRITTGICIPKACNTTESKRLILAAFIYLQNDLHIPLPFNASARHFWGIDTCVPTERPYDNKANVAIAIISLILIAVAAGTFFDVFMSCLKSCGSKTDIDQDFLTEIGTLQETKQTDTPPGVLEKIIRSFSLYSNACKIMSVGQKNPLSCLNGIRFLSMTWVILGHTLFWPTQLRLYNNGGDFKRFVERWTFQAIVNATLSVDTFFLMSGLLVAYLTLSELEKRQGRLNWLMFYVHRYVRLTPAYMLVLMVYYCLLKYIGDGPLWIRDDIDPNCKSNWWTNALYVNNVVRSNKMCMGWSWYLANDMQFYIIAPMMVYPLYRWPIAGSIISFLFMLGCLITRGVVSSYNGFGPNGIVPPLNHHKRPDGWDILYVRPWTRVGPYVVGVYVGFLLYKWKCELPIKHRLGRWIILGLGWTLAAFFCTSTLYGLFEPWKSIIGEGKSFTLEVSALYNSTWRIAWSLGVGWLIFACSTGYGGTVPSAMIAIGVCSIVGCFGGIKLSIDMMSREARAKLLHFYFLFLLYGVLLYSAAVFSTGFCIFELTEVSRSVEQGLIDALNRYKTNGQLKKEMDFVQIEHSCCGVYSYVDWFATEWLPETYLVDKLGMDRNETQNASKRDSVPFSCCDPMRSRPCIHDHVHDNKRHSAYDYRLATTLHELGCKESLSMFFSFNLAFFVGGINMILLSLQMVSLIVSRLLQTSLETLHRYNLHNNMATFGWLLGGYINELLSWSVMGPLSRLTYCAYLVHPCVMTWFYYTQEEVIMLTVNNIILYFLGFTVASYLVAFATSLLFEAPIMGLEKALLGRYR